MSNLNFIIMLLLYIFLSLTLLAIIAKVAEYLFQKYWVNPKQEKIALMSDNDLIQRYYQLQSDLVDSFSPLKEKEVSLIHTELQKREIA